MLGLFDHFSLLFLDFLLPQGQNWGSRVFWAPTFPADLVQSYKVLFSTLFFCQYVEMVRGKRFLCYISEGCNFFFYFVHFFPFSSFNAHVFLNDHLYGFFSGLDQPFRTGSPLPLVLSFLGAAVGVGIRGDISAT